MHINRFTKLLLTSFIVIASCFNPLNAGWFSKKNKKAKVLRTYITAKIKDMDPATISCIYKAKMISQVYETLLAYEYTSSAPKLVPLLLREMPKVSKDGCVYTFRLKQNVHFHTYPGSSNNEGKGPELTAKDVIYSLVRLFDPAVKCKNLNFINSIKGAKEFYEARKQDPSTPYKIEGIEEVDKYTVRIILDTPNPDLRFAFAMPFTGIVSNQAHKHYKGEARFYGIGTGAWTMPKKFNPRASKYIFKKNKDYHSVFNKINDPSYNHMKGYLGKKLPFADELHIKIITESTAAWLELNKRRIDIAPYLDPEIFANNLTVDKRPSKALQKKGIQVLPKVPVSLRFLYFNLNVPFLQNVKVRQALALSTDINRINRVVYDNHARMPQGLILPGFKGYQPDYRAPYNEYNAGKAKVMLEEAGFAKGAGIPSFMLYVPSGLPIYQKIGTCIKEDWRRIGIHVNIVSMPFNDLVTKTKAVGSTTWHGVMFGWGLDMPDMINFFQLFYGENVGGNNTSGYNDKEYNALYEEAAMMRDSAKRARLYIKMNKIIGKNVPCIVMPIDQPYMFYHKRVKNIKPFNVMIYDTEKYLDVKDEK